MAEPSPRPPAPASHPEPPTATPRTANPPHETPWLRLSRRMLLVQPIKEIVSSLPAFAGILVAGFASGRWSWWATFLIVVPVVLGTVRWAVTFYRVTPDQLQLRGGLVQRNVLTARLDRVRTVDVTASPLHRLLGIASVQVGTGAAKPFVLDGLPRAQAEALRESLLHARHVAPDAAADAAADDAARAASATTGTAETGRAVGPQEAELARFRWSWLRFAPFTMSGLVAVAAVFGFVLQAFDQLLWTFATQAYENVGELMSFSWWVLAAVGALALLAVPALLSTIVYAATFGGYRLTRHAGGTLRIVRGLLTTRSTTVEEKRVRGAVLLDPAAMRPVRGSRALLLTTGLPGESSASADVLVPAAPRALVAATLERVLGVAGVADGPLRPHGPAATRRCWTRALAPAAVLAAGLAGLAWWWGLPALLVAAPALLVLAAVPVAAGRAASLGHDVVDGHLVSRSGVFPRRRSVLDLSGTIGWSFTSTPWQRRAGLVTASALTAAGSGSVVVLDVPESVALRLALRADADLCAPFVAERTPAVAAPPSVR